MEHIKNFAGVIMPQKATSSYILFKREFSLSEWMSIFLVKAGKLILENPSSFKSDILKMIEMPGNEEFKSRIPEQELDRSLVSLIDISNYELYYGQMCFARMVDNMTSYFKDILKEVIQNRPEIISSSEKSESTEFIMSHDSIEELKFALVDRKIDSLFYGNIDNITKYFKDRLNIDLFESIEWKEYFNHVIKIRNIIVHNRGVVNKSFYKEFPDPDLPIGAMVKITYEQLSRERCEISNYITRLDDKIATKFNLERRDIYPQT